MDRGGWARGLTGPTAKYGGGGAKGLHHGGRVSVRRTSFGEYLEVQGGGGWRPFQKKGGRWTLPRPRSDGRGGSRRGGTGARGARARGGTGAMLGLLWPLIALGEDTSQYIYMQ
ncbi:unnamed protein product [Gadus morhua 'NCC']